MLMQLCHHQSITTPLPIPPSCTLQSVGRQPVCYAAYLTASTKNTNIYLAPAGGDRFMIEPVDGFAWQMRLKSVVRPLLLKLPLRCCFEAQCSPDCFTNWCAQRTLRQKHGGTRMQQLIRFLLSPALPVQKREQAGSSWKYLGAAKWCKPSGFTTQNACLGELAQ